MKCTLKTLLFVLFPVFLFCQTPYSVGKHIGDDSAPRGSSAYNPYISALNFQFFNNGKGFSENFWPSGTFLKELGKEVETKDRVFHLPLFANISLPSFSIDSLFESIEELKKLTLSESGLSAGIYPYWILNFRENNLDNFYLTVHSEISFRYNRVLVEGKTELNQNYLTARLSAGVEVGKKIFRKDKYTTISLTPTYTFLNRTQIEERYSIDNYNPFGIELSIISPFPNWPVIKDVYLGLELTYNQQEELTYGIGAQLPFLIKDGGDDSK